MIVPLLVEIVPEGLPVNVNVPVPPTITFFTVIEPFFVFVNVHVTSSPAATLNVAAPVTVFPVLLLVGSLQSMLVSAQPEGTVSVEV